MKYFLFTILVGCSFFSFAQERLNPIVNPYGGIFEIEDATVKADPNLEYKIVIDLASGAEDTKEFNWHLNNVARLLNLHAVAGVPKENLHVVVAVHASATYSILNDKAYKKEYGIDNPNTGLINALTEAGVEMVVCGQSLIARDIDYDDLNENIDLAVSMLTTVTTHQLKGYALLKF